MTSKNKAVLMADTGERNRTLKYKKGNVDISFTVRTDIKEDLKNLLECLAAASHDVKAELDSKA